MNVALILLAGLLLPIDTQRVDPGEAVDAAALADLARNAGAGLSRDPRPAVVERSRAERTKARSAQRLLVAAGVIEGDAAADEQAICSDVELASFSAFLVDFNDLDNSLYSAEALQAWAGALDLSNDLACDAALRAGLETLVADLHAGFTQRLGLILRSYNQNHRLKVFAAILAARLALDQRISDHAMVLEARRQLTRMTHALGHARGGYGEGPSYWAYQASQTLPVWWALGLTDSTCVSVPPEIGAWTCQLVHGGWRWAGDMRVPAEQPYFAPFDDSTPGAWFPFALVPDSAALALARLHPPSMGGGRRAAEVLAWRWRGEVVAGREESLIAEYESGQLGLRSKARRELLLMQAEHGRSAGEGRDQDGDEIQGTAGHNQSAPLSLMWFRMGRWRLIDPGYLGWSDRAPVASAEHHTMPLINGRGPQGPVPHVPRLIDDGAGGLIPEDPNEEGGYILTPGGRAFGEVVSDRLSGLGAGWTLVSARAAYGGDQPEVALRRLLLHHIDGALAVLDVVSAPETVRLDLHWQLPSSLSADGDGRWRVAADGEDSGFELRSQAFIDGVPRQANAQIISAPHDAWHWRREQHRRLALSWTGKRFVVLTVFGASEAELVGAEELLISEGQSLRLSDQDGWTLGEAAFDRRLGLIDRGLGLESLQRKGFASQRYLPLGDQLAGERWWPVERYLLGGEASSTEFWPADQGRSSDLSSRWVVALEQPDQAPLLVSFERPEAEVAAQGCGCVHAPLDFSWLVFVLLARRPQRTKNSRRWYP